VVKLRYKDSGRNPTRRIRGGWLAPLAPLYGRKTASGHFQCGKRSWLWRAIWSRPSMTRSRSLPASAMPRRRCYLRRSIAIGSYPMDGSATETGPSSWLEQPTGFSFPTLTQVRSEPRRGRRIEEVDRDRIVDHAAPPRWRHRSTVIDPRGRSTPAMRATSKKSARARIAQSAALRAAFIPSLARLDPESGAPMRRVARRDEIPENSRPILITLPLAPATSCSASTTASTCPGTSSSTGDETARWSCSAGSTAMMRRRLMAASSRGCAILGSMCRSDRALVHI